MCEASLQCDDCAAFNSRAELTRSCLDCLAPVHEFAGAHNYNMKAYTTHMSKCIARVRQFVQMRACAALLQCANLCSRVRQLCSSCFERCGNETQPVYAILDMTIVRVSNSTLQLIMKRHAAALTADEKWDQLIAVMLSAPFHATKAVLPAMLEKGALRTAGVIDIGLLQTHRGLCSTTACCHGHSPCVQACTIADT
jgi:NAD(P)-dependent dehydrogenase (short-subunit alcohol dehydrogenase family)